MIEKLVENKETIGVETGRRLHQEILQCGEDRARTQEACNRIFTLERREKMVADASVDRKGRQVRYYRYMAQEIFLRALNEGCHAIENNHTEDFDRVLGEKEVQRFFREYLDLCGEENEDWLFGASLEELLDKVPSDEMSKRAILERDEYGKLVNMTNRNVVDFIRNFCERRDILESLHYGSGFLLFSPFLSVSVGGSPLKLLGRNVLLELILPDECISSIPSESSARMGEKHAFVMHGFSLDAISRVFCSMEQYEEEVLKNPNIPVGAWVPSEDAKRWQPDRVDNWRWHEVTDDCLPVGLLERYGIER